MCRHTTAKHQAIGGLDQFSGIARLRYRWRRNRSQTKPSRRAQFIGCFWYRTRDEAHRRGKFGIRCERSWLWCFRNDRAALIIKCMFWHFSLWLVVNFAACGVVSHRDSHAVTWYWIYLPSIGIVENKSIRNRNGFSGCGSAAWPPCVEHTFRMLAEQVHAAEFRAHASYKRRIHFIACLSLRRQRLAPYHIRAKCFNEASIIVMSPFKLIAFVMPFASSCISDWWDIIELCACARRTLCQNVIRAALYYSGPLYVAVAREATRHISFFTE